MGVMDCGRSGVYRHVYLQRVAVNGCGYMQVLWFLLIWAGVNGNKIRQQHAAHSAV